MPESDAHQGPVLSRAEILRKEQDAIHGAGLLEEVLMENAGLLAALELEPLLQRHPGTAHIFCGGGNNGGDGYVVARQLRIRGYPVEVVATRPLERLVGAARSMRAAFEYFGGEVLDLGQADAGWPAVSARWGTSGVLVDAVLGTGLKGPARGLEGDLLQLLQEVRSTQAPTVVAIDLPSGMECDSGQARGPVLPADQTLSFMGHKPGFQTVSGRRLVGEVRVLPIGIPCPGLQRTQSNHLRQRHCR